MRRYIISENISDYQVVTCDALVVGAGIAGLYAALSLPSDMKVTVATKGNFDTSNSWLAQGGIASVMDSSDKFTSHIEDTLKAGAGVCDEAAVKTLVEEGPKNIEHLIELAVPFDKRPDGSLMLTREGGHSSRRIVHCGGDATGRETTKQLSIVASARENIKFLFEEFLVDILTDDSGVIGAVFSGKENYIIKTSNIILATGGIGALYNNTTNPSGAVGDGISAALRAGAVIENMEFVQFHPTTLSPESSLTGRRFLISEAVRGEGGILRNGAGEAFMRGKHQLADLAPRDIVTREILKEMRRTGEPNVFLDVSSMSEEFFSKRFPTIYAQCQSYGINVPHDKIPVKPAQHYLMGGIKTDLFAKTNIEGLYAAGECACTGVHGANRLASNSMLECLVFGRRAAEHITNNFRKAEKTLDLPILPNSTLSKQVNSYFNAKREELRDMMTENVNAVRTPKGLAKAKQYVDSLMEELDSSALDSCESFELYSLTTVAKLIIDGATARKESVGAHYIEPDET